MAADRSSETERVAVIPSRSVTVSNEVVRVGCPDSLHAESPPVDAEPQVEVIRLNDRIQAIEVTCSCGRRTRIECAYKPADQNGPQSGTMECET